jgi:hypothetical protein
MSYIQWVGENSRGEIRESGVFGARVNKTRAQNRNDQEGWKTMGGTTICRVVARGMPSRNLLLAKAGV